MTKKKSFNGPALVNALTASKVKIAKIDNIALAYIEKEGGADTGYTRAMLRIRELCK